MYLSILDIIMIILQAADGGAKKTHIMHQCNLSSMRLHAYLDLLVDMGFLGSINLKKTENKGDSTLFKTTSKGKAFIKEYRKLKARLVD